MSWVIPNSVSWVLVRAKRGQFGHSDTDTYTGMMEAEIGVIPFHAK